eukprot:Trichotokara_eunicae@DN8778_c0_g1_i1.p1
MGYRNRNTRRSLREEIDMLNDQWTPCVNLATIRIREFKQNAFQTFKTTFEQPFDRVVVGSKFSSEDDPVTAGDVERLVDFVKFMYSANVIIRLCLPLEMHSSGLIKSKALFSFH